MTENPKKIQENKEYRVTMHRAFQWLIIIAVLLAVAGGYFYYQSRGATTVSDSDASFEAPLTHSLDLARGTGGPTFTRADGADRRATVTDFEGNIRKVKAGEARFEGARRVENLLAKSTPQASGVSNWLGYQTGTYTVTTGVADPSGGTNAVRITMTGGTSTSGILSTLVGGGSWSAGSAACNTVWARVASGTQAASLFTNGTDATGAASITITTTWQRFSACSSSVGGKLKYWILGSLGSSAVVELYGAQSEDTTGQSKQIPSEYVSIGVLSAAPYHGAGVDGVKYFATENANTVASTVVTEATNGATLEGHAFGSLPGTSGSYLSTPDSAANSITGDIDIRAKVAMADWTPAALSTIASKYNFSGLLSSYLFRVTTGGNLNFTTTADGSNAVINVSSSVIIGATDGTTKWVRVTVDVDDGSGNRVVKFYTSDNGESWTQLGSTSTTSGTTSIYDGQAPVEIGTWNGGASDRLTGKIYRVQVLNGIDGMAKVDFDPSQWSSGSTWTSRTSEVWTRNGGSQLWKNSLKGYLAEGSRTNLLLQSEAMQTTWSQTAVTIAADAATAPDSTTTADEISEDNTSAAHQNTQTITKAASALAYTVSVYLKASERSIGAVSLASSGGNGYRVYFNLSNGTIGTVTSLGTGWSGNTNTITSLGNGWYRCTLTATSDTQTNATVNVASVATDGVITFTGTTGSGIYAWGAQLEQAAFASSYIPTTSASVTRAADLLTYPIVNIEAGKGAIYLEGFYPQITSTAGVAVDISATTSTKLRMGRKVGGGGDTEFAFYVQDTAVDQAWLRPTAISANTLYRAAMRWSTNDFAISLDGAAALTDTLGSVPANLDELAIGVDRGRSTPNFGTVRNVKIWKKTLTNTELQNLAAGSAGATDQASVKVNRADFEADLTSTLDLQRGVGAATFTRADGADRRATVTDFEGLIRKVKAGEARFEGARRVENLCNENMVSSWNVLNVATLQSGFTDPNGGSTAYRLTATGSGAYALGNVGTGNLNQTARTSVWIKRVTGTGSVSLYRGNTGTQSITSAVTTSWRRVTVDPVTITDNNNAYIGIVLGTSGDVVDLWHPQYEIISGQTNQSPGEYVSKGALSSTPYHGAGVDGVKYFDTENANTVTSNVVTEPAAAGTTLESHAFGSLPGTSGSYFSTPDSAAASIIGDIDIRVKVAMTDWTPAANVTLAAKYATAGQQSWLLRLFPGGTLGWLTSADGSASTINLTSAATGIADGTVKWLRVTHDVDNGAGGNDVKFWTSDDGVSWTQLGSTATTAGTTSVFDGTMSIALGTRSDGATNPAAGKFYRMILLSGIDGTAKVDFDPSQWSSGDTWTSRTGEVWTRNGTAMLLKNSLKGYLAEGSRTNYILQSEDFSTIWSLTNTTVTTNALAAPDGTLTADKVEATTSAATSIIQSPTSSGSSSGNVCSVYAKRGSGDTDASRFAIRNVTTSTNLVIMSFNYATGAITYSTGSGASAVSVGNGWWRIMIPATSGISNGDQIRCYVGFDTNSEAAGEYAYLWGAALEAGAFASSYIPTTTASVTRAADSLTYPTSGNFSDTAGTAYAEAIYPNGSTGSTRLIGGSAGDNGAPIYSSVTSGLIYSRSYDVTTSSANPTGASNINSSHKYAAEWTGNLMRSAIDGNLGAQTAYDGSYNLTAIGIGLGGGLPWYGTIKNVKIWQKALSETDLTALASGTSGTLKETTINVSQNSKQTSGLVGLWSFNGPDLSGTTAYDRSGQNNHGTLTGGPAVTEGKSGQALSFDGTDDFVSVPDATSLNFGTGDFSLSLWLNTTGTTRVRVVNKFLNPNGWIFDINTGDGSNDVSGNVRARLTDSNSVSVTYSTAGAINDGAWHHLVMVVTRNSATGLKLYVDGAQIGTSQDATTLTGSISAATPLGIGAIPSLGGPYFNGNLDEVRVYNTALGASDIANLYNLGR